MSNGILFKCKKEEAYKIIIVILLITINKKLYI